MWCNLIRKDFCRAELSRDKYCSDVSAGCKIYARISVWYYIQCNFFAVL